MTVSFYKKPKTIDTLIDTYRNDNKIIRTEQKMSQDLLTRTSIVVFKDKPTHDEYSALAEIVEMTESRKIYCDERNISIQVIKEEVTN